MTLGIKSRWLILMLVLGFVVSPLEAEKPKPPAPPPAPGYIFFSVANTAEPQYSDILQMRADGTGLEVAIPAALWKTTPYGMPIPSNLRYNGEHWWLQVEEINDGQKYPWGALRRELVVFQAIDDGQGNVTRLPLILTNLFDLGIVPFVNQVGVQTTRWSNDNADTFVSFVGAYATETGIAPGLYVFQVPVIFDATGFPSADLSTIDASRIPLGQFREYEWSPDGMSIVYDWLDEFNVSHLLRHSALEFAADLPPMEVWSNTRTSSSALNPKWSQPDDSGSTRIAFASHRGVWERDAMTISPIGTGLQTLQTGKSKGYWSPLWAPLDGSQLVVREVTAGRNSISVKIIRVNRDGSGRVDLLASEAQLIAWRLSIEAP
ncbi:MAG: hypothetical protein ACYC4U_12155 [Pirellulaceae bacterium]